MIIAEIEFLTKKDNADIKEYIENLAHNLRMGGRIVSSPLSLMKKEDSFVLSCRIPESTSLDIIHKNRWYKALNENQVKINVVVIGKDLLSPNICSCINSDYYILSGSTRIPLSCGICSFSVPLYRIPFTYEADPSFYDVICWNTMNLAWSDIEFHSIEKEEKMAHHQLCDLSSELSQTALNICTNIQSKAALPCYFYLENLRDARSIEDEMKKKCPKCGENWRLRETLHDTYDLKCDTCCLLSNFSYEVRNECCKLARKL